MLTQTWFAPCPTVTLFIVTNPDVLQCLRDVCGSNFILHAQLRHIRRIGTGAFASVHAAKLLPPPGAPPVSPPSDDASSQDASTTGRRPINEWYGRDVAVKRLNQAAISNQRDVADLIMEATVLHKIHHKYVGIFVTTCTKNKHT